MVQTGAFVFELFQQPPFLQKVPTLSVKYRYGRLKHDNYINLVHYDLDNSSFLNGLLLLRRILLKFECDGLLHSFLLVHEVSLIAVV